MLPPQQLTRRARVPLSAMIGQVLRHLQRADEAGWRRYVVLHAVVATRSLVLWRGSCWVTGADSAAVVPPPSSATVVDTGRVAVLPLCITLYAQTYAPAQLASSFRASADTQYVPGVQACAWVSSATFVPSGCGRVCPYAMHVTIVYLHVSLLWWRRGRWPEAAPTGPMLVGSIPSPSRSPSAQVRSLMSPTLSAVSSAHPATSVGSQSPRGLNMMARSTEQARR